MFHKSFYSIDCSAQIETRIREEFQEIDCASVIDELNSIRLSHVMAESETNLRNTRLAILKLAEGKLARVQELTESAKVDFRDIIYWASNAYDR